MTRFAVFAILALLATTVAAGTYPSVSTSVFNSAPVAIWDKSSSSDSVFVNISGPITYGPATTNETVYVWALNYTSKTNLVVTKRTLNATAIGAGATSNLTTASDTTISTSAQSEVSPTTITGLGYFAFFTVNETGADGIDQVYITIVSTSANTVKLTSNTDSNLAYSVQSTWLEDGYFYVIFSQRNASSSLYQSLWAQAIAYNGSTLYTSPMKVASVNGTSVSATGGPVNSTNSTSFLVVWKQSDTGAVSVVPVTRSTGAAGSSTTLKTDGGNITYSPAGTIGSWTTYGALVNVIDNSTGTLTYSVLAYYNGTYTNSTTYSAPSGYTTGGAMGRNYVNGYGVFWVWADATAGNYDSEYIWTTYYANGTVNTTTTIGNFDDAPDAFVDGNGTLWLGYTSQNYSATFSPLKGYLGKLVGQVNAANILASVFAFLSLLLAALFAF